MSFAYVLRLSMEWLSLKRSDPRTSVQFGWKLQKNVSISIDHDANNRSNVSYHRMIDRSKLKASNLEKLVRRNVETVETWKIIWLRHIAITITSCNLLSMIATRGWFLSRNNITDPVRWLVRGSGSL